MNFCSVNEALEEIRQNRMLILVDEEARENEGDLFIPCQHTTAQHINFMIQHGRGLVCVATTEKRLKQLSIAPMTSQNEAPLQTNFYTSVDYKVGLTTGISALERAQTCRALADEKVTAEDFVRPGHIFPLSAHTRGLHQRQGHTEAAVSLCQYANLFPAGVICEIISDNGEMLRNQGLEDFAQKHNLKMLHLRDLHRHELLNYMNTHQVKVNFPTQYGQFDLIAFQQNQDGDQTPFALIHGDIEKYNQSVLTRIHSQCLTGDLFHSYRCDCGQQLEESLKMIQEQKSGILIYLRQEGRGIGLYNKIRAYSLQDQGLDTVEANHKIGFKDDERSYELGALVIQSLGIQSIELITNNPEKILGLEKEGVTVTKRVPLKIKANQMNSNYLEVKRTKLGHLL